MKMTIHVLSLMTMFMTFAASENVYRRFPIPNCTSTEIDIIYIIDNSTYPSEELTTKIQAEFLADMMGYFFADVEVKGRVRAALISYQLEELDNGTIIPHTKLHFSFKDQENLTFYDIQSRLQGLHFDPDVTIEMSESPIKFAIIRLFHQLFGARPNAEKIILMTSDVYELSQDDIRHEEDLYEKSDVRLIYFYRKMSANVKITKYATQVLYKIPQGQVLKSFAIQYLCRFCRTYYFTWHGSDSCYIIIDPGRELHWYEAARMCTQLGSDRKLISFDTKAEMEFIEEYIIQNVIDKPGEASVRHDFFIGLSRNHTTIGRRFQWLDKTPLLYSHWYAKEPNGGVRNSCTFWRFPSRSYNNTISKWTNHTSQSFWMDVGCGERSLKMIICEWEDPAFPSTQIKKWLNVKVEKPTRASVEAMLKRGNIVSVNHQYIVSMSSTIMHFLERSYRYNINDCLDAAGLPLDIMSSINWPIFKCTETEIIYYRRVCDGISDCFNGADEDICKSQDEILKLYRDCEDNEYQCDNKMCIPKEAKCDLWKDCEDGSDEWDCDKCSHGLCGDGTCMPRSWFMDGEIDCFSEDEGENIITDESNQGLDECIFVCNRTECVTSSMLSQGVQDCVGPEGHLDEYLGRLQAWKCPHIHNGWAPRCILQRDRYGEFIGCRDMSHLSNCENFTCPAGFFKIMNSYCIPTYAINDGMVDAPFSADEEIALFFDAYPYGYFLCHLSGQALHPDLVCDGFAHCRNREDELECGINCPHGYMCVGGSVSFYDFKSAKTIGDISFIDKEVRYVNLSNAHVPGFFSIYPRGHFRSLLHLYLSNNDIRYVGIYHQNLETDYDLFVRKKSDCSHDDQDPGLKDFRRVTHLDLSFNSIQRLGLCDVIATMDFLRYLNLSNNPLLKEVDMGFAGGGSFLKDLDLSNTALSTLDRMMFEDMTELSVLLLIGTRIQKLSSLFPASVKVINLENSPIQSVETGVFDKIRKIDELRASSYQICCPQLRGEAIDEKRCYAPEDALSSCSDLMKDPALRSFLWLIGIVALLSNVAVIIIRLTLNRQSLKSTFGLLVTNLGFSDFLMGLYLIIIASADAAYRGKYVLYSYTWVESHACRLAGFLSTLSSEVSALLIFFITVNRYLVVKFPYGQIRMSRAVTGLCCIGIWVIGVVIAVIPLLSPWAIYSSNSMCLGLPLTSEKYPGNAYSVTVFVVFNFILFVLIAVGQLSIYCILSNRPATAQQGMAAMKRRQQDLNMVEQLSLIVLTDFCCWFPICMMGIMAQTGTKIGNEAFAWSAALLLPINSALNPILYTITELRQKWIERTAKNCGMELEKLNNENRPVTILKLFDQKLGNILDSMKTITPGEQQKLIMEKNIQAVELSIKKLKVLLSPNDRGSPSNESSSPFAAND